MKNKTYESFGFFLLWLTSQLGQVCTFLADVIVTWRQRFICFETTLYGVLCQSLLGQECKRHVKIHTLMP